MVLLPGVVEVSSLRNSSTRTPKGNRVAGSPFTSTSLLSHSSTVLGNIFFDNLIIGIIIRSQSSHLPTPMSASPHTTCCSRLRCPRRNDTSSRRVSSIDTTSNSSSIATILGLLPQPSTYARSTTASGSTNPSHRCDLYKWQYIDLA